MNKKIEKVKVFPDCYDQAGWDKLPPGGILEREIRLSSIEDADARRLVQRVLEEIGAPADFGVFKLILDFGENPRKVYDDPDQPSDPLGCYFEKPDGQLNIVLFIRPIIDCATKLNCSPKSLGIIVFLHEFAHLAHLGLSHNKQRNKPFRGLISPKDAHWVELVAQLVAWKAIQDDSALSELFESDSQSYPDDSQYRTWEKFRKCAMEEFREYLAALRAGKSCFSSPFFNEHRGIFGCAPGEQIGGSYNRMTEIPDDLEL